MDGGTGLLGLVRASCRAVAGQAGLVSIDRERIADYAATLPLERLGRPTHDPACHHLDHGDETIAFFLTLDAINFGSGYFPQLRKRPGLSGYLSIAASLTERFARYGPFSARELTTLTPRDLAGLFGQSMVNEPIRELMGLYAAALHELGTHLLARFAGSFTALVSAADSSAENLVRILLEIPSFRDTASYRGMEAAFYKRAQILAADLELAFRGEGPGRFHDVGRLTIFADNLVPHVFRVDGILRYDPELAERIDREEPLAAGSPEEVEIRACAVHAAELTVEVLREQGKCVSPRQLDYLLWNRGHEAAYREGKPRHLTRTIFY
jgi:hypothetical protein